ncbi:uncharacterized protein LACBIDRAFT_311795 [Laccaria bicolor S238N-H82]|uniref:Predicted protein n=1 Tax=Laccaria bicolor (strain S238N-H82 / ATCC MYA-4686) TaxID=486041 RepID=B0CYB2_LACBS|nr:uncharacterized protein LACBIDRAFT_311795 [Laccaria bicolor S238N-H82]EDR12860.1 predicted protein [Laccaria bicolor S238N-H82]|eukprot:XP_001877124.1 predicted protein [Laccaria bicolor S238N-H82]
MFSPRNAPQPVLGSFPTSLSDESPAGAIPPTAYPEGVLLPSAPVTERILDNEGVEIYGDFHPSPIPLGDAKSSSSLSLLENNMATKFPSSSSPSSSPLPPNGVHPQLNLKLELPHSEIVEILSNSSPIPSPASPKRCNLAAATQANYQDGLTPLGGSQHKPIVIDSSPIKPAIKPSATAKIVHPFFGSHTIKPPPASKISSLKGAATLEAPYPDRCSQHVKGPQSLHESYVRANIPRRQLIPKTQHEELNDFTFLTSPTAPDALSLEPLSLSTSADKEREDCLRSIPDEHVANHAAIGRVVDSARSGDTLTTSRHPWAEKWRPRFAQEVLGNEASAIYLRDWLRGLELQLEGTKHTPEQPSSKKDGIRGTTTGARGLKRPYIVREVDKRQRKKARANAKDDDWIVNTDESGDEDVPCNREEDMDNIFLRNQTPPDCATTKILPPRQTFEQLHNTILLSGPYGTGKTACVYACAEELGWEVFEVYPGIGKRNGANVDNLIGEVGRNHLVRQIPRKRNELFVPPSPITSSGNRNKDESLLRRTEGSQTLSTNLRDILCQVDEEQAGDKTTVRQSLILLEEVDILFKEDTNFWPTLTRVIRECKRPVVCTCNDISLVPLLDLPLQKVLVFEPCPPPIAVSYLQGLFCAEGYAINRDVLLGMYGSVYEPAFVSIHNTSDIGVTDVATHDLRRTIHSLQVVATTRGLPPEVKPGVGEEEEPSPEAYEPGGMLATYRAAANHADHISFLDSFVSQESAKVLIRGNRLSILQALHHLLMMSWGTRFFMSQQGIREALAMWE